MARARKQPTTDVESKPGPRGPARRTLLFACAAVCAAVAFAYAGSAWAAVLYRLLTDGVILLAWIACAAGLGSAILRVFPISIDGDEREPGLHFVTAAALGIGAFSLATLGLGLAGLLGNASATALLVGGGAIGAVLTSHSSSRRNRPRIGESIRTWLLAPAGWSWLWLAAMPFLGLALVAALLPPGVMWPEEPHPYDVVEYHLQIPREWYELGRIVPLHHNIFSFFPFNVEMQYLLAMHLRGGPWAGMYLAHFMHLAMIVLTVAAIYGFARRLSPSNAGATIAAVAAATVPWLTQLGTIAYNEGGLLLFGTLAMGWAFRAVVTPARRLGRFPVAGLMAGFACGSKLTAVPEILVAVGIIAAVGVIFTRQAGSSFLPLSSGEGAAAKSDEGVPLRLRLTGVATFFLAGLLAFAPWLIRNQFWAGNPVFPEGIALFGQGHFTDAQADRWKQAHAPRADQRSVAARLTAWRDGVWTSWQYGYVLLPLGLSAGTLTLLRNRGPGVNVDARPQASATHLGNEDLPAHAAQSAALHYQAREPRPVTDPRYSNVLKNTRIAGFLLVAMFVALSVVWLAFTHLQGRFFILGVPIAALLLAGMPWGRLSGVGAGVVVVAAVVGFGRLHRIVVERLVAPEILGFENVSAFVPDACKEVPHDKPIGLIGDARAFVYPGSTNRLFYRTVFDVDTKPGETVIDAWRRGAPSDAWLLVDPIELERFRKTYAGIPSLPPEYAGRTEPFVIPPKPGH